jgi:hypothetical protein
VTSAGRLAAALTSRFWAMPRLVVILNSLCREREELSRSLRAWRAWYEIRQERHQPIVRTVIGCPDGGEIFARAMVGRNLDVERLDAVIQVTLPCYKATLDQVLELQQLATRDMLDPLSGVIDRETSHVLAGAAHCVVNGEGTLFLGFAFPHDPAIPLARTQHWWAGQHAELALTATPAPMGYQQLHTDQELVQRMSDNLDLPVSRYDMWNTIALPDFATFAASVGGGDEEYARRALEDEKGHILYGTWRGGFFEYP